MGEIFNVTFLKDRGESTEEQPPGYPPFNITMGITETMTMEEILSDLVPLILQRVSRIGKVIESEDITIAIKSKDFVIDSELRPQGVYGFAMYPGNRGKMIIRNNTKVSELKGVRLSEPDCWKNIYVHDPTTCRVLEIENLKERRDREARDPQAQLQAREDADFAQAMAASLEGDGVVGAADAAGAGGLAGRAGGAPMGARQDAELEAQQFAEAIAASEAGHQQSERARAARAGGTPHGAVPPARIAGGAPPPEAGGAPPHEAVPPAQLVPGSPFSEADIHSVVDFTHCTREKAIAVLNSFPSVERASEHILMTGQDGGGRGFGLAGRFGGSFWDGGKRKKSRKRKSKRRTSKRRTSKRRTSKRRTHKRRTKRR